MAKGLTIVAMAVAVLVLLLFALDLAVKFPFTRARTWMDVVFALCAAGLAYLSWSAFKELT
jgi:hypothetical protein